MLVFVLPSKQDKDSGGMDHDGRLSFWLDQMRAVYYIDVASISLHKAPPAVYGRQFECGVVIMNADGPGWHE